MANTPLSEELHMAKYWIDDKGLAAALSDYLPLTSKDPAIAAAMVQRANAERAILARIEELCDANPHDYNE